MGRKKGSKNKPKKQGAPQRQGAEQNVQEVEVPKSIRERAARLAKKKAQSDKETESKKKKIPKDALEQLNKDAKNRAKAANRPSPEHERATWTDILSSEIIKLQREVNALRKRLDDLQGIKS